MTPNDFVAGITTSVIDDNMEIYRNLFRNTLPQDASDPYWKEALRVFRDIPERDREVFFQILRQVGVDTVSNMLGVLDGVNFIEGADSEFTLIHRGAKLNGDLQDLFLARDEEIR